MNFVSLFMLAFAVLAAIDRIIGNKFGLGAQFERGFMLLGTMALSMIGMIVLAPGIAVLLSPIIDFFANTLRIEPSVLPAIFLANDMGGAPLADSIAVNAELGRFNALVVSSMMGATVSFTLPFGLSAVKAEKHADMMLGFLYGIVTVPIGCLIAGLVCRLPVGLLLLDLLPLILFSILIAVGLILCPRVCVKIFCILGIAIKILITVGLVLGMIRFLTGYELIPGLGTLEEGAMVCVNASVVMAGAFPFIYLLSKILAKPVRLLGQRLSVNDTSALGLVSTLATNATTFEMMNGMDQKGTVLNSAFTVSAAFTFAGHLAFTLAYDADYIAPMIVGKLIAGLSALVLAALMEKRKEKRAVTE